MMPGHLLRRLDPRLICLLAQAAVAAVFYNGMSPALAVVWDADVSDPTSLMLGEIARVLEPDLTNAFYHVGLLACAGLPLLGLSHLWLQIESTRSSTRADTRRTRTLLDAIPAHVVVSGLKWAVVASFLGSIGWANLELYRFLDRELTLWRAVQVVLANSSALVVYLMVLVVFDALKLQFCCLDSSERGLSSSLRSGFSGLFPRLSTLIAMRGARLCVSAALSVGFWLVQRSPALSGWTSAFLIQGGIYLAISIEAWWYRRLAEITALR